MWGWWGVKKIRDAVPFFPIEYIRRSRSHTFLLKPRWNHSLRSCRWHHGLCLLSNGCSWIGLLNCPIWSSSRHSNLQCSPLPSSNCWGCSPVPPAKWLVRLRLCRCHTSARAGLPTSGLDSPQKILSKGDRRHSSKASLKWPVPSLFIAINNLIPVPMAPVEAPALGTEWNPVVTSVIYGSTYPGISFLVGQRAVVKVMTGTVESTCWDRLVWRCLGSICLIFLQRTAYFYIVMICILGDTVVHSHLTARRLWIQSLGLRVFSPGILLPPIVQKHPWKVNWELWIVRNSECEWLSVFLCGPTINRPLF